MWGAKRFSGSLLWWAAGLAVLTLITRIPLRSTQLFAWDSANFALALQHYNVAWHQPQPPGYILYVAAARLLHVVVADANAAYVWLSVVASVGAIWCAVLVGGRLFGTPTGVFGGLILTTSSLFWGQGEVAYPYSFLALFSSLIVLLALRNRSGGRDITLVSAALLAIAGGFRPELVPFLLPLWLWGAWRRPRWRWLAGLGLLAVLVAAWYVPMVWLSGGWQAYQTASGGYFLYFLRATSGFGKLLLAVLENTRTLVGYTYNGLGLALLPLLYIAGRFFAPPRLVSDTRAQVLGLWLAPPLAFYLLIHIGNPGYLLSLLPALCLLTAHGTLVLAQDTAQAVRLARPGGVFPLSTMWRGGRGVRQEEDQPAPRWPLYAATSLIALIALSNAALFLVADGEGRLREIRAIDRILSKQVAAIEAQFPVESTLILAYDRSRQLRYYLPDHRIELLFTEAVAVAARGYDPSRYWERRSTADGAAGHYAHCATRSRREHERASGGGAPSGLGRRRGVACGRGCERRHGALRLPLRRGGAGGRALAAAAPVGDLCLQRRRQQAHVRDVGPRRQGRHEQARSRHVFGLQRASNHLRRRRHRPLVQERRVGQPREQHRTADTVGFFLGHGAVRQADHAVLRGLIRHAGDVGRLHRTRRHVDDDSVALRPHRRQHRAGDVERTGQVDVHHAVPRLRVELRERPPLDVGAGRVAEDVQRAEPVERRGDQGGHGRAVGQIGRAAEDAAAAAADFVGQRLQQIAAPRRQHDRRPFLGKQTRRCLTHPAARPRHQRHPPIQCMPIKPSPLTGA